MLIPSKPISSAPSSRTTLSATDLAATQGGIPIAVVAAGIAIAAAVTDFMVGLHEGAQQRDKGVP